MALLQVAVALAAAYFAAAGLLFVGWTFQVVLSYTWQGNVKPWGFILTAALRWPWIYLKKGAEPFDEWSFLFLVRQQ